MLPSEGPWKKDAQEQNMRNSITTDMKKRGFIKKRRKISEGADEDTGEDKQCQRQQNILPQSPRV
jgi:hypothetical protein